MLGACAVFIPARFVHGLSSRMGKFCQGSHPTHPCDSLPRALLGVCSITDWLITELSYELITGLLLPTTVKCYLIIKNKDNGNPNY